jgi:hypothetical protein
VQNNLNENMRKYGLDNLHDRDKLLIMANVYGIIKKESSFNPNALGYSDDIGLMQVIPESAMLLDGYTRKIRKNWEPEKRHAMHEDYKMKLFSVNTNIRTGTGLLLHSVKRRINQGYGPAKALDLATFEYNVGAAVEEYISNPKSDDPNVVKGKNYAAVVSQYRNEFIPTLKSFVK